MKTVILCGGRGTRLREFTAAIPKVLVEVGGKPILWHIMKSYAVHGFSDFVLALGYKGQQVEERMRDESDQSWSVTYADTGLDTNTGERLGRLRSHVEGTEPFFATYGDGVSDIDLASLRDFHCGHGRAATITVVRPELQFGLVEVGDENVVSSFQEKPQLDGWINGGFFVFDQRVYDYLSVGSVLERGPLEALARESQLMAYRHEGFWACMDTYKDNERLNAAWAEGDAPWRSWGEDGD
jgi:glucose-1-phosphate cytidylyltransferase